MGYESAEAYVLALHRAHVEGRRLMTPREVEALALRKSQLRRPEVFLRRTGRAISGAIYKGDSAALMLECIEAGSVDLIMTSPPFALLKKKPYGNEDADEYLSWFRLFAEGFRRVLRESGSLVIDIGGSWKRGAPERSLYHFELASMLCREYGFHLCQEFYWWNPARLPAPAEWVNVRRIRVKDAVDVVWWLSKTPFPKASNRRVLQPYSQSMKKLQGRGTYNDGGRPSGYNISKEGFLVDHGGSIPPNLIAVPNTESSTEYQEYCRRQGLKAHPARFPAALPAYFVHMLTDEGDLVLDPFAGSCVTGEVAENAGRSWACCEIEEEYLVGALGRFQRSLDEVLSAPKAYGDKYSPYTAYPPAITTTGDAAAPLPRDGGRRRS